MTRRTRGFALILTIWAMLLLSGLAASLAFAVRVETQAAIAVVDQLRGEAIVEAGIRRAILALAAATPTARWLTDGRRYPIRWPGAKLSVRLRSESGKIDLNFAPAELLGGLFRTVLDDDIDSEALASAVIDWRDRDQHSSVRGAEAPAYVSAGRDYVPADGPLMSVAELGQVLGFTSNMVERLRPYVSVHSRRPRVDALAADAVVLGAIPGIDADTARRFVEQRDNSMNQGDKIDFSILDGGRRYLEFRPTASVLEITSTAQLDSGASAQRVAVVRVRPGSGRYQILLQQSPATPTATGMETDR